LNYWLKKAVNVGRLMRDDRYINKLTYLTTIQRFFIKMYFRSLVRAWSDE